MCSNYDSRKSPSRETMRRKRNGILSHSSGGQIYHSQCRPDSESAESFEWISINAHNNQR